ncbi:hypothetical protein GC176_25785 [bacterium]|nr:hypothetical protein [bacterium]
MVGPQSSTTWHARWPADSARRVLIALVVCVGALLASESRAWPQDRGPEARASENRRPQSRQTQRETVAGNSASTRALSATLPDAELSGILERRGNLTLRDVTIVDALFALREQWKIDMVIADDVQGQVNATFTGASLREILDSLLLSRGYGYQIVGRSIVILPLNQLSALKPLFNPETIRLQHADPEEMLEVVDLLLSPQGKALPLPSSQSIMVLDYPDRMLLIRSRLQELDLAAGQMTRAVAEADQSKLADADAFAAASNSAGMVELDVRVFRPQFVKVQTLLPAVESLISRNGRVAVLENEDQVIVADRSDILDVIEEAVAALDQPRPQVRIWAMIYDCSIDDVERLGVNWRSAGFGRSRLPDGTPADQILLDTITAAAPAVGVPNGALALMSLGTNVDINAVINALKMSNQSRLLADPNVVVTNHEPAKISIVTEVPYQQLTQGLQGGSIGTTAFREAGVSLEVTPHIARDGTISMLVNPQFSVLTGYTETSKQPIIDRREAKTTVRVLNGETFVLGGLRQRTQINNRSGIPYLKDVKYVGKLFRYRQNATRDSELLVFITPEIVSAASDPRPREVAADTFGREELNRNHRAPDVLYSVESWDSQSFGGPWQSIESRSNFGFTPTVDSTRDETAPSAPSEAASVPNGSAATRDAPFEIPYEDQTPPFVDSRPAATSTSRPMAQRLQGSIQTIDQSNTPLTSGPAGGPVVPTLPSAGTSPGNGLNTPPTLNLDSLMNLLPMSGQETDQPRSTPARSTPTRPDSSRIDLLKFESPQFRSTATPAPRPLRSTDRTAPDSQTVADPVTIDGPGSSVRR